jgi:cellulose synthase (UDP-forming)
MKKSLFWLLVLLLSPVAVLVVITPMDSQKQYLFGLLSIGILFLMGFSKNRSISVIMVVTSLLMSTRYMYFRLTQTLHFNSGIETILGMGLFLAEVYIWVMLLLNYLQTIWPLKREIVPLPDDMSTWPTVDIYIPSYNEPLEVVRDTVLAAQCIDYPADKMKIYLLDDGKRSEFAVFAADVGVGYITRNDNKHAKAGNLNHAMTLTQGELICVFDCDHVATRVFLQATVGGFLKDWRWCRRRTTSTHRTRLNATSPLGAIFPMKGCCFMAQSSRATTTGTRLSSAAPAPLFAVKRWSRLAVLR